MSEQTKGDWQTMEAGIGLDRVIAERLGWKAFQNVGGVLFGHLNKPLGSVMDYVPCYSTDLNAAITLLPLIGGEMFYWTLGNSRIDLTYRCTIHDFTLEWNSIALTPALAVVRSWLLWTERAS